MVQRLRATGKQRSRARLAVVGGLSILAAAMLVQQASATQNNSGRYVVSGEDGVWRAVDHRAPVTVDRVFYPSWYFGLDMSQTEWEADDFENESTGAGLVVGNHFSPHLRWELRHRYQEPEKEYTGVEGQSHTLSSLSLDYVVSYPEDGFSPVLRAGVAQADGKGFEDDQSDAAALLGLGMQWREDRWIVRLMAEQMGEDQLWGALTVAAYLGGNEQRTPKSAVQAEVATEIMPADTSIAATPVVVVAPAAIDPVIAANSGLTRCGTVFSTRELNDIQYVNSHSSKLSARSAQQLAQIGASYARRHYVAVDVDVSSSRIDLAEQRAVAVIAALNLGGDLDGRISSRAGTGVADSLSLSMRDMRRCK